MNNYITLLELGKRVQAVIQYELPETVWLQAELSEVRTAMNGHCYVEFVQKQERGGGLVAKSRGQIWAGRWALLRPYFERTTGQRLSPGMSVLVQVEVTFHPVYGFSLNILDIDPTYTIGDIARRRQEILRQLEAEGVLTMNKELPLPRLLQRIAVISSATAAGYGDFSNQLASAPENLFFHTELFPATMQGDGVERSIISALTAIAQRMEDFDVVVIIRGGGSTSDLTGFDTLALAENVAQFPLPIITGIGHERDDTIIDIVAHTRVKTPTAAAELLIHNQLQELAMVRNLEQRLHEGIRLKLQREHSRIDRLTATLPTLMSAVRTREESKIKWAEKRLQIATESFFMRQHNRIEMLESKLKSASPERILRLGFSITRVDGKAIHSASDIAPGTIIETTLADGTLTSKVIDK